MSIAIYVNSVADAESLIGWGVRFASGSYSSLLIIVPRRQKGKAKWDPLLRSEADESEIYQAVFDALAKQDSEQCVLKQDIAEGSEESSMDRILIETRELVATNPEESFVEQVETLNVSLLILPSHEQTKSQSGEKSWTWQLFENAPCETLLVRGKPPSSSQSLKVMVASETEEAASLALKRAVSLVQNVPDSSVTFLFVRPDDDEVATSVAHYRMDKVIDKLKSSKVEISKQVALGDSFSGSLDKLDLSEYSLVLAGSRNNKRLRKFFRLEAKPELDTAFATIRPAIPVGNKFLQSLKARVRRFVPQLDRDRRITLVDKLQTGSHFNFDFCALIALSTFIAALGLLDDSAAVVIGAMLVAPLMTPLVGIGFALVQGNEKLIRTALPAVGLGFLVAFLIGSVVGIVAVQFAGYEAVSAQMAARDLPSLLDLLVALASGIAGAYALGRPDLLSALPGVAIAAALVPPIATSGMALTMGNWILCGGALLLFLTNIVFIVLGTALTFSAVGIDTRKVKAGESKDNHKPSSWPRYVFAVFVILSLVLAVEMAIIQTSGGK